MPIAELGVGIEDDVEEVTGVFDGVWVEFVEHVNSRLLRQRSICRLEVNDACRSHD